MILQWGIRRKRKHTSGHRGQNSDDYYDGAADKDQQLMLTARNRRKISKAAKGWYGQYRCYGRVRTEEAAKEMPAGSQQDGHPEKIG